MLIVSSLNTITKPSRKTVQLQQMEQWMLCFVHRCSAVWTWTNIFEWRMIWWNVIRCSIGSNDFNPNVSIKKYVGYPDTILILQYLKKRKNVDIHIAYRWVPLTKIIYHWTEYDLVKLLINNTQTTRRNNATKLRNRPWVRESGL